MQKHIVVFVSNVFVKGFLKDLDIFIGMFSNMTNT
jgi:hypothetical protein